MIGSINIGLNSLETFCNKHNYEVSVSENKKSIFNAIEPINTATNNNISFCRFDDERGLDLIHQSKAGCLFVPSALKNQIKIKPDVFFIYCDHPRLAILYLINEFWDNPIKENYIKKAGDRKCIFYTLKCFNDQEEFYKIGITMNTVHNRYNTNKKMPYNYEIIREIYGDASYIWDLEISEKRRLKDSNYQPIVKFAGSKTECFKTT